MKLKGFTLIELVVSLLLLSIIIAILLSANIKGERNREIFRQGDLLFSRLNQAKLISVNKGLDVVFKIYTCNDYSNNTSGYVAFLDTNRNGVYDSGQDEIIKDINKTINLTNVIISSTSFTNNKVIFTSTNSVSESGDIILKSPKYWYKISVSLSGSIESFISYNNGSSYERR